LYFEVVLRFIHKNPVLEGLKQMNRPHVPKIGLPLIALCLDLVPIVIIWLSSLFQFSFSFFWLIAVLSPIAGLIAGVASLRRGKAQIGLIGKIIAIIAIATPLSAVAFVLIFFFGVVTGVISLM